MSKELLPCPFCGGAVRFRKALWISDGCTDAIIHAEPTTCGLAEFDTDTTDESVIAAWNHRAPTEREKALEAALTDMLSGWRYIRKHHGDLYGVGWDRCEQSAAAALADTTAGEGGGGE